MKRQTRDGFSRDEMAHRICAERCVGEGTEMARQLLLGRSTNNEIDTLYKLAWEKLHDGDPTKVSPFWRECVAFAAAVQGGLGASDINSHLLDLALIFGGPHTLTAPHIHAAFETVTKKRKYLVDAEGEEEEGQLAPLGTTQQPTDPVTSMSSRCGKEIPTVASLSLSEFTERYFKRRLPVLIRQYAAQAPAVAKWNSKQFWYKHSHRTVPAEIDYYGARHDLVNIGKFIDGLSQSSSGYIAQHTLLEQIPELAKDIATPDYCCAASDDAEEEREEEDLRRHVFFGPSGTVTPIHHDPYHNAFVQVVGQKYIRLYAPNHSENLRPRDDMPNNSFLPRDIITAPAETLPKDFLDLPYLEAVLSPGDLLFLPKGWWHFVKSLSVSISIAFHFA